MTANSNTFNATALTDAELEHVTGGGDVVGLAINPILLKAEQELAAAYQKNHPIQMGPFPPPHTAVPH